MIQLKTINVKNHLPFMRESINIIFKNIKEKYFRI